MKTIKINIAKAANYLSDSISALPANCLFDKGKVGCGGTTLAIEAKQPYVIAVPFVALADNKAGQHSHILSVYKGVTNKQIKDYVSTAENPVIITTYDSLERVTNLINPADFKLLVDEYHLLFNQYSFRDSAINSVLSLYKQYSEYCFMTATPLEDEFILDELKDLPIVEAVWPDTINIKVKSVRAVGSAVSSLIDIVNHYLVNEETNLYVFVNSVEIIKEVVKATGLTISNCNVIYSKYNKTEVGIQRGQLPTKDGSIAPKKINMLTSTCFEGCDIYDENGEILIVSDASKAHTLTDISTSLQQIAGRIRNSKYINEVTHLYSTTRYSEVSYAQFKANMEKEIEETKQAVEEFNNASPKLREMMLKNGNWEGVYFSKSDDFTIRFNANLVKLDIYNFKICKHLYQIRVNAINKEYSRHNIDCENLEHTSETVLSPRDLDGFEKTVKALKQLTVKYENIGVYTEDELATVEAMYKKYPFLPQAIAEFGFKGIEDMNYVITTIKRKLINVSNGSFEYKVFKMLEVAGFAAGEVISLRALKNKLQKIYDTLEVKKTAKASDINEYFVVKQTKVLENKKRVDAVVIVNPKFSVIYNK